MTISNKFVPTGETNLSYQIDGSKAVFNGLECSGLSMNSGFTHSSINRFMLTCNLIQYHAPGDKPRVLDYGSSEGTFKTFWDMNYLMKDKKFIEYTGLEVTPKYVEIGKIKGHDVRSFDANNQDVFELGLSKFDVILMQQFIEHISRSSLDNLLTHAYEFLEKDGLLIISAPDPKAGTKIMEDHHDHEYTIDEITDIVTEHGFTVKDKYGWLGFGIPHFDVLSESEKEIYTRLRYISDGYANSVMCMINPKFAPYYYLVLTK